jgi:hypothetical protein
MPPPLTLPNNELINIKDLHLVHNDGTVYAVSLFDLITEATAASTAFAASGHITIDPAVRSDIINRTNSPYNGVWSISGNNNLYPSVGALIRDSNTNELRGFVGRLVSTGTKTGDNIPVTFTEFSFADKWTANDLPPDWSARSFTWTPSDEA